jgi:hypothetical protein
LQYYALGVVLVGNNDYNLIVVHVNIIALKCVFNYNIYPKVLEIL